MPPYLMLGEILQPLSMEATMPDSARDRQTKPESDKRQPETVQLTAEELKAIAGGANIVPPTPVVSDTNDVVKAGGGKRSHP
jgi:hypothetical protein